MFLSYEVYVHAHDKPVAYIASEYARCIALLDEKEIGTCLDELAQYSYDHYSIRDIGVAVDGLTYQQKNRWCHEVMHYLGWKAYKEKGSVADAFMEALPLCDSGMYHGVMEEYLRENGMSDNVGELIKSICVDSLAKNPDFSEGTKALCYHGLGHGLMYVTASDLGKSLDFCDLLTDKAVGECYTGVFMEYKTSKAIGALDNDRALDDFSQCLPLTDHQKSSCFNTQGLNYLSLAFGDVKKAAEYCGKVPPEYLYNCYVGVGSNTPSPSRSHTESALACKPAREVSESAYEGCIQGAISFVLQLDRGEPEGADEFCKVIDEDTRGLCYHKMGNALQAWVGIHDTFESKCAVVADPAYNHECLRGMQGKDDSIGVPVTLLNGPLPAFASNA
jgi:hypothetical protein